MSKEERKKYIIAAVITLLSGLVSGLFAYIYSNAKTETRSFVEAGFLPRDIPDVVLSWYHKNGLAFWIFGIFASVVGLLGAICQSPRFGLYIVWGVIGIFWEICLVVNLVITFDRSWAYLGIIVKLGWIAGLTSILVFMMNLHIERKKKDEKKKSTENKAKVNVIALAQV
jgi:hypothetical protein